MLASSATHRKRLPRFEKDDKQRLIAAVRARRLLWDMTDSEHSDFAAVKAAWQSVANELHRDANDCKVAWRSLRQSYRYHCKAAYSRFKTEELDDDGEVDPLETPDINWEFADDMAFLLEFSKKRPESSVPANQTPADDATVEDYTETEYLELDDQQADDTDDAVEYTMPDDLDDHYTIKSVEIAYKENQAKSQIKDVLCRTCTQPIDAQTTQNLFQPENYIILQQIKELTELVLQREEELSDFICGNCLQNLEIAAEFRRVCIEAQSAGLMKVQMKEEPEDVDYLDSTTLEPAKEHSLSQTDLTIEAEQLEDVQLSDNDNYYEEVDVELLRSTPSPKETKKPPRTPKYQCHECGLTFTSQDLLKMHLHEVHQMQLHTRFVCKHCGHDFKYSTPLVEHLKSIGVNFGYKCEDCGQKFHSRHFLKKHKRRVHGQADEHICHICGKNFTTGFNLRNHIIRHAGTRPHKCKLCSAAFSTTAELNNHKRTHDNVRPYPCRYACGKSFRHCSNRSTHERVHMDGSLRPFQCEYCEKSFVTKGDCRAHQLVHTMSRNFSCDICEQSFKLQKHYQQHLTTKSHKKLAAGDTTINANDLLA